MAVVAEVEEVEGAVVLRIRVLAVECIVDAKLQVAGMEVPGTARSESAKKMRDK